MPPAGPGAEAQTEEGPGATSSLSGSGNEPVPAEVVEAAAEERLVVETDSWSAEFTNRGAQLLSLRLKRHRADNEPVELVHPRAEGAQTYGLVGTAGQSLALNDALFVAELKEEGSGGQRLSFRYAGPLGQAEKLFECTPAGFCEVTVTVAGSSDWAVLLGPGVRQPTAVELKNSRFRWGAVYKLGSDRKFLNAKKAQLTELPGPDLRWVALDDTYFLNAVIPWEGVAAVTIEPFLVVKEDGAPDRFLPLPEGKLTPEQQAMRRELSLLLAPRDTQLRFGNYWGAKDYGRLAALPYGLEETVDFGWFPFLARPLQLGLRWIHDELTHNYGWAIVLMTLLIRLAMLPLTHRSIVHSQKMQKLSPKMQAIRNRWRGKMRDKQGRPNPEAQRKMNEEIMGLYREEGVNPVSGCFPVLLQFPVFLAFYYLLSGAVELRNAAWILWIHDLSVPDPHYVLPLVMGGSQLLQQVMMPIGGDPMQRRLFLLMPVFLTYLFLNFASGLVLYWLTSNVIGIIQQAIYRRLHPVEEQPAKSKSEAAASKNK